MSSPASRVDPREQLRSRRYLALLGLAAVLGAPIAALAYGFLNLTASVQHWVFTDLPSTLGVGQDALWWPLVPLPLAGLLVGLIIRYLPGRGGKSPADGFHAGGVVPPAALPGISLAALASIGLGAVVGPEGPLVALGGGLAYLAVWLRRRDLPTQTGAVIAVIGSFAAVSTLLGSPLTAAFLLMEAAGLGGATAELVLVPGLLGAGVGALIFVGLGSLTGHGTFSLAIPNIPGTAAPTAVELLWALAVGIAAAPFCMSIHWLALRVRSLVFPRVVLLSPVAGLVIACLAVFYAWSTGKPAGNVLFSGQTALPQLVDDNAAYTMGVLLLLILCKGLAYVLSLGTFRGGPTFPAMFIGAATGIALSHLPGLAAIPGVAIGIGAFTVGMLRLPLTSVLLTSLFLGQDGITLMPLTIVAVVVSYVLTQRLSPPPATGENASAAATGP